MNGPLKMTLALGAVAALAAAFYLTKPGGNAPAVARRPVAPPAVAKESAAAPGLPAIAAAPVAPAPQQVLGGHGPNAVVRSGEEIGAGAAVRLPLGTPVWSAPVDLSFSALKALRRRYREVKTFAPEDVARLHGAAVVFRGALMPIDPIPKSGEMRRFWLANPVVVMAGCVFCFPPTMADLVYVTTEGAPFVVDRERLYRSVEYAKLLGRFELGPGVSDDGVEYMFSMEMRERLE
jgi:hypothetical protein